MESKEEVVPDLMKQNISKENIMKLFDALCKHKKEYGSYIEEYPEDFDWSKCKDCVLSKIVHYVPHGFKEDGVIKRDVCFAIWHDEEIDSLTRIKKGKSKKEKHSGLSDVDVLRDRQYNIINHMNGGNIEGEQQHYYR